MKQMVSEEDVRQSAWSSLGLELALLPWPLQVCAASGRLWLPGPWKENTRKGHRSQGVGCRGHPLRGRRRFSAVTVLVGGCRAQVTAPLHQDLGGPCCSPGPSAGLLN